MESEWEDGVVVIGGEYSDGETTGKIAMADFGENIVEIDMGDGFFWRGTSQEFSLKWDRI